MQQALRRIQKAALPLIALGAAGIASAQTTTGTTTGTSTPGVPNTGAGGDLAITLALLVAAIIVAGAGAMYLYLTRAAGR